MCEELGAVCTESRKEGLSIGAQNLYIFSPPPVFLLLWSCVIADSADPNRTWPWLRLMCNPVESWRVVIPDVSGVCRTEVLQQQSGRTKGLIIIEPLHRDEQEKQESNHQQALIDHKRLNKKIPSHQVQAELRKLTLNSVSSERLSRETDQTQSCLAVLYLDGCSRGSSDSYQGHRKAG